MPRPSLRKSLKHVCVDTVLFFALFALIGHLTINFWERYTIQTELSTMKHSLHTLKDTITNIGRAYDNLHTELKDLNVKIVDKRNNKVLTPCLPQGELEAMNRQCKSKCTLDRRHLHDLQVQAVHTQPRIKKDVGITTEKLKRMASNQNKTTDPYFKDATTATKNPPRSTGVTSNMSRYETEKFRKHNDTRRNLEYYTRPKYYKNAEHCKHFHNYVNTTS